MENNLEEPETYALTDQEIFTKIWFQPRLVFRFIEDYDYDKFVPFLLICAGIYKAFDKTADKNINENFSLLAVIAISVIFGGLFGWLGYYIYAAAISLSGKWLGGKAKTRSILNMMAHGMTPSIIALFIFIIQIIIYGNDIFKKDFEYESENIINNILGGFLIITQLIFIIYTVVLCVIGLSEIQNFSIWSAILNFLLPILFIVVPIFLVLFISGSFSSF